MEDLVRSEWDSLCHRYSEDPALVGQLWDELEKAYTAKDRHYHNLGHIHYMLEVAHRYSPAGQSSDLLLFAIFYHDIVYKATRSDNEEQSSALAQDRLHSLGIPEADILQVKEMILATKTHQTAETELTKLLLDLDLAILGADEARYNRYSQGVRKEYSMYPDLIYKPGRRKVLKHFLSQKQIYKTPTFQAAFEDRARENLKHELAILN